MNKFLILIVLTLIVSCKKNTPNEKIAEELKSFYGQTITFPDELKNISDESPDFKDYACPKSYKIIAYIDSADCTPCTLQSFALWKNFTEKLEQSDAELIIILKSGPNPEIQETFNFYDMHFPAFINPKGDFKIENHLPTSTLLHTFLLDKNDQVAFVGSPIQNENSWQLFQKVISQLNTHNGILPPR